ncbi:MAG: carbohydrate kinase family protein [Erysipelotrichaceae bacterium]|nr:carbohydrate kinase family protein [Erysipelotrichaceae bacterium]
MREKYILGIGAANVDVNGRSRNPLIMKDSNPGKMNLSVGGVTRNVLENLSRLDLPVRLITAIGGDPFGQVIKEHCAVCHIDLSAAITVEDDVSSTYMAILNNDGDMQLALSDMHVINAVDVNELKKRDEIIRNAALITFDPCLAEETMKYLTETYGEEIPLFCDPVSTSYARRLKPYLKNIHTLKPNRLELSVLADHPVDTEEDLLEACRIVIEKGVKRLFVSMGRKGCLYYDCEGNSILKAGKPVDNVVSASGAGDAFTAGIIYGYYHGFDIPTTLDYALASGSLALLSSGANNPELSVDKLKEIIREDTK